MKIESLVFLIYFGIFITISGCDKDLDIMSSKQDSFTNIAQDIEQIDLKNDNQPSILENNIRSYIESIPASHRSLTSKQLTRRHPNHLFKSYKFDVNADGINDTIVTKINDGRNFYQGDDLLVYLGLSNNKYLLSLETTNFTDEVGWFLYDIYPRADHSGFILKNYFSIRGNSNQSYYFEKIGNEWIIIKYISDGTLISGEDYYCIENNTLNLSEFEYGESSNYYEEQFKEECPPLPIHYQVLVEKVEILNDNFESRSPPNYYIKGDFIEAVDQNEDWVKVSYKNGTKFGWIDKRDLSPVLD